MGTAVVGLGFVTQVVALRVPSSLVLAISVWASWGAVALAGFLAAHLAPARRLLMGAFIALPATALALMLNIAYEALGLGTDFPGIMSPPTSRGPPATEITEAPGTARWRAGGRLPVSRRAAA